MSSYVVTPFPLAMIVCDYVFRDPGTHKCYLMGTFSTVSASEFPCRHESLFVYISLTDGKGTMPIQLQIVRSADDETMIYETSQRIEIPDPLMVMDAVFNLTNVVFPSEGEYRLKLFVNEEFLLERRLMARLVQ